MPLDFVCTSCGKSFPIADQFSGQQGFCIHCHQPVQFPQFAGTPVYAPQSSSTRWLIPVILGGGCLLMLPIIGILVALLLPAVSAARDAARASQRKNNLKQIAIALLNYESAYRTLPPQYIADEDGRPLHSWRVLILPFLEEQALYAEYDFNEPWDSPKNQQLAARMPRAYLCPGIENPTPGYTSYLASVGPGRAFDGAQACKLTDVADGLSNTIGVLESTTQVLWLDPLEGTGPGGPPLGASSPAAHRQGMNVLFLDGSVVNFHGNTSPQVIEALQTIAGGEGVSP
ncbi:MAG: DUF1559 domain-containing protein [Planctomycetaceae bacterium]|nr:DUF1559 domain-containing protein [Planctomycetaceae bacterium]